MENTRNFCIISHIDHGKSTLADRFLELTGTVEKRKMQPQYLDMMELERERGITIKLQPVRMVCRLNSDVYFLNLIDTPGHIDFSYEVSRSLAAVEGAILLVDATKGIQAQTLTNLNLARKQNLAIIPAVNKIDMVQARVEQTVKALAELLKIAEDKVFRISAKYGTNVEELLRAVIKEVPPPQLLPSPTAKVGRAEKPLRALIFDSKYDSFKGVVGYVRIIEGSVSKGQKIYLMRTKTAGEAKEVGYFAPEFSPKEELDEGEIGYIATGVKEPGKVRVGDTVVKISDSANLEPLAGYQEPKPMIFASVYPENSDDYNLLIQSLEKLKLTDGSLIFEPETKSVLGRGFRCGFLGMLHAEIITERLRREFGLNLVISVPTVIYKIIDKKENSVLIYSPSDFPDPSQIKEIQEPWAKLEIITPEAYLGSVLRLLDGLEGIHIKSEYMGQESIFLIYETPLREIIVNFYDKLKNSTQGYASMNYEVLGYRPADLIKLDILIAGKKEESLSKIAPRRTAQREGQKIVKKLKEILPPQQFAVALQAAVQGKIIARETIRSQRKDVTAPLYGGDYTRKRKLLEKQKKGKKALQKQGRVRIPAEVYIKLFKVEP